MSVTTKTSTMTAIDVRAVRRRLRLRLLMMKRSALRLYSASRTRPTPRSARKTFKGFSSSCRKMRPAWSMKKPQMAILPSPLGERGGRIGSVDRDRLVDELPLLQMEHPLRAAGRPGIVRHHDDRFLQTALQFHHQVEDLLRGLRV